MSTHHDDDGFTVIEVVVAMLLLSVLALMLIPVFVSMIRTTERNTTLATASQLAGQQIDEARSRDTTCAALQAYQSETVAPVVDARGVSLQATRDAITCPSSYPGTATVTVSVARTGSAAVLASVSTFVMLTAAS